MTELDIIQTSPKPHQTRNPFLIVAQIIAQIVAVFINLALLALFLYLIIGFLLV